MAGAGRSRRPAVIGLRRALGDERVAAGRPTVAEDVLELADLVAGQFEPGQVVALEPEVGTAELGAEAFEPHERSRQVGKLDTGRLTHRHSGRLTR
jgi:hypothetical protein